VLDDQLIREHWLGTTHANELLLLFGVERALAADLLERRTAAQSRDAPGKRRARYRAVGVLLDELADAGALAGLDGCEALLGPFV